MDKWGIPEKTKQSAVQTHCWPLVNMTILSNFMTKSSFDYNIYNDFNDYNDNSDYNDYNDNNNYNDYSWLLLTNSET